MSQDAAFLLQYIHPCFLVNQASAFKNGEAPNYEYKNAEESSEDMCDAEYNVHNDDDDEDDLELHHEIDQEGN